MDATKSVRRFLLRNGIHDYAIQGKGAASHGVRIEAKLLSVWNEIPSKASLYRPKTKDGDPRIWFTRLAQFADPDEMLLLMRHGDRICVVNISRDAMDEVLDREEDGPLRHTILSIMEGSMTVSQELLQRLQRIASSGLVRSVMDTQAPTAVGRTLESCLGIAINSSKQPDYKGIELKSYRRANTGETRRTLFAKVPNSEISKFKSSRQILETFGYAGTDDYRLYCTVSALAPNSQGLSLWVQRGILHEVSHQRKYGAFASWLLQDLQNQLSEKHRETFWVRARSIQYGGHEYFRFTRVLHTKTPVRSQFGILIEQGEISMDHLIKRNRHGRVTEKGPLFKINSQSIDQLFPSPRGKHSLRGVFWGLGGWPSRGPKAGEGADR